MSLRTRMLLYLAALVAISLLPLDHPWPLVIAVGAYLVLVFPALSSSPKLKSRDRCPACGAALTRQDGIVGSDTMYFGCANGHRIVLRESPSLARITGSLHGTPPPPPPPPKREGAHPEMAPPPAWWSREQWDAAMRAVDQCRCDPYDCGPYGHDDGCPAGILSQGQYNAVKGE